MRHQYRAEGIIFLILVQQHAVVGEDLVLPDKQPDICSRATLTNSVQENIVSPVSGRFASR